MAAIHQLSYQNFQVIGRERRSLYLNLPQAKGTVLVFFKSNKCPACREFEPMFAQIAQQDQRIDYAIADLSYDHKIIMMSRDTSTPIAKVPFIMIYANGHPVAKYKGSKSIQQIKQFISQILQRIPKPQQSQPGFMPHGSHGQGNIYEGNQYPNTGLPPRQQQHAGYTTQRGNPGGNYHKPEIGKAPSLQGIIKGGGGNEYAFLNQAEEEDDEKLLIPDQVTPHNMPWEGSYNKVTTDY